MAKVGYWRFDIESQTPSWSEQMFTVMGREPGAGVPSYAEYKEFWHPDDWEMFDQAVQKCIQGEPANLIVRIIFPDGSIHYVNTQGFPVYDENQKIKELFGTSQDITELVIAEEALRESEQKYRSLIEQAQDGVVINVDNRIRFGNNRFFEMHGYTREELIGQSFAQLIAPEEHDRVKEISQRRFEGENVPAIYEITGLKKDGSRINIEVNANLTSYEGQPAIVTLVRDITERKRVERELQASLEEKVQLIRELYHRTKNNMQVVISMLMVQAELTESEQVQEALKDTTSCIQAMSLVHEKLYQSQRLSQINLDEYIRDLAELLVKTYQINQEQVSIEFDLQKIPVLIDTAIPCGLVLNELISNSLKHAFEEGKSGQISIRLQREQTNEILLSVSDNGSGLPAGIDLEDSQSFGLQSITAIVEHQLQGQLHFENQEGLLCQMRFRDDLYHERVK
jgi:PAS domain S-box-containing protein